MAQIYCKKCGITAISKCPNCRNTFYDNQSLTLLENTLGIGLYKNNLLINLQRHQNKPLKEMVQQAVNVLSDLLNPGKNPWLNGLSLEQFVCNHEWAWQEGQQSEIDCGCKLA